MTLTDNLIAYWKLDEASGDAADVVGGNTLTNNGSTPYVQGKINNGIDFESSGGNQYLSIADNAALSFNADQPFTYNFWWKPESRTATQCLLSKNQGGAVDDGPLIIFNPSGQINFVLGNNTAQQNVTNLTAIPDGTWAMVTAYHDPVANVIGVAINGGTPTTAAWTGGTFDNTSAFNLGRRVDTGGNYADGVLDEVGFWKRVLTSDEITSLYNVGAGKRYPFTDAGFFVFF